MFKTLVFVSGLLAVQCIPLQPTSDSNNDGKPHISTLPASIGQSSNTDTAQKPQISTLPATIGQTSQSRQRRDADSTSSTSSTTEQALTNPHNDQLLLSASQTGVKTSQDSNVPLTASRQTRDTENSGNPADQASSRPQLIGGQAGVLYPKTGDSSNQQPQLIGGQAGVLHPRPTAGDSSNQQPQLIGGQAGVLPTPSTLGSSQDQSGSSSSNSRPVRDTQLTSTDSPARRDQTTGKPSDSPSTLTRDIPKSAISGQ